MEWNTVVGISLLVLGILIFCFGDNVWRALQRNERELDKYRHDPDRVRFLNFMKMIEEEDAVSARSDAAESGTAPTAKAVPSPPR